MGLPGRPLLPGDHQQGAGADGHHPQPLGRRGAPPAAARPADGEHVLDLSMGVTLFTSPSWRARK